MTYTQTHTHTHLTAVETRGTLHLTVDCGYSSSCLFTSRSPELHSLATADRRSVFATQPQTRTDGVRSRSTSVQLAVRASEREDAISLSQRDRGIDQYQSYRDLTFSTSEEKKNTHVAGQTFFILITLSSLDCENVRSGARDIFISFDSRRRTKHAKKVTRRTTPTFVCQRLRRSQ